MFRKIGITKTIDIVATKPIFFCGKILSLYIFSCFILVILFLHTSVVTPAMASNSLYDILRHSTTPLTNLKRLISPQTFDGLYSVTLSDTEEINNIIAQNKLRLENLNSKPVFRLLDEGSNTLKLSDKLDQTKVAAANIYSGIQNLKNRILLLAIKWPDISDSEVKSELTSLSSIFTQDTNQKNSSLASTTEWLKSSWDNPTITNLMDEAQTAQSQIDNLLNDVITGGKINSATVLDPIIARISKLDELVGSSLATATDPSLFGFIRKTSDQIDIFDKQSAEGIRILTSINDNPSIDMNYDIEQLKSSIIGTNLIPNANLFFTSSKDPNATPNSVLGLLALIDTNKKLLSGKTGAPIQHLWLEEGSIVFRLAVSNPNRTQIGNATIKFSLPEEINKDQVISLDKEISLVFDPKENALVGSGEIVLTPLETRTFMIEVEDIWNFNPREIENLHLQVEGLIQTLKYKPSYSQALLIKKDVENALNKIENQQRLALTPETKIVAFRQSSQELNKIEQTISSLKGLVLGAQSSSGIFNITEGLRTHSLQGLLILIISSAIFIYIYIQSLQSEPRIGFRNRAQPTPRNTAPTNIQKQEHTKPRLHRLARIVIITMISGGIGSIGTSLALKTFTPLSQKTVSQNDPVTVLGTNTDANRKYPYEAEIVPPKEGDIPIRTSPSVTSPQISSLKEARTVSVFKKVDQWVMIMSPNEKTNNNGWWINETYLVHN